MPIVWSPVRTEYQPDWKCKILLYIVRPSKRTSYFGPHWYIFSRVRTVYTDDLNTDVSQVPSILWRYCCMTKLSADSSAEQYGCAQYVHGESSTTVVVRHVVLAHTWIPDNLSMHRQAVPPVEHSPRAGSSDRRSVSASNFCAMVFGSLETKFGLVDLHGMCENSEQ